MDEGFTLVWSILDTDIHHKYFVNYNSLEKHIAKLKDECDGDISDKEFETGFYVFQGNVRPMKHSVRVVLAPPDPIKQRKPKTNKEKEGEENKEC